MSTINKKPIIDTIIKKMNSNEINFLIAVLNTKDHKDSTPFGPLPEYHDICMAVIQNENYKPLTGVLWNERDDDGNRIVDSYYLIDLFSGEYANFYHIVDDKFTKIKEVITLLEVRYWLSEYQAQKKITTIEYDDSTLGTPTSEKVDTLVRSLGFEEDEFPNIQVRIKSSGIIWSYVALPTPKWVGGGVDSPSPFDNNNQGTIIGFEADGYVEKLTADPDGVGHVHGWSNVVKKITSGDAVNGAIGGVNVDAGIPLNKDAAANSVAWRGTDGVLKVGTAVADTDATNKKYVADNYVGKLATTDDYVYIYAYDKNGQLSFKRDILQDVVDVKVDNVSVVDTSTRIANISLTNKYIAKVTTAGTVRRYYGINTDGTNEVMEFATTIADNKLVTGAIVNTELNKKLSKITTTEAYQRLYSIDTDGTQTVTLIKNDLSTDNTYLSDNKTIRAFVNSSIASSAANYVTSNVAGDNFATHAALIAGTYYHAGVLYSPKNNDYAIVAADETHSGDQYRYSYDGTQWNAQYKIGSAFTAAQQAAIDSGITASKVTNYDNYATNKMDAEDGVGTGTTQLENLVVTGDLTADTGSEVTIDGNATFSGEVDVPTPTADSHAVNKSYVDNRILRGSGAPTVYTVGVLGQLYVDSNSGIIYRCSVIGTGEPIYYTWEAFDFSNYLKKTGGQVTGALIYHDTYAQYEWSGKTQITTMTYSGITVSDGSSGIISRLAFPTLAATGDDTIALRGDIKINETLEGGETALSSFTWLGTKYKISGGSGTYLPLTGGATTPMTGTIYSTASEFAAINANDSKLAMSGAKSVAEGANIYLYGSEYSAESNKAGTFAINARSADKSTAKSLAGNADTGALTWDSDAVSVNYTTTRTTMSKATAFALNKIDGTSVKCSNISFTASESPTSSASDTFYVEIKRRNENNGMLLASRTDTGLTYKCVLTDGTWSNTWTTSYLPLTGGTLTGSISVNAGDESILNSNNNYLTISGGTNDEAGAIIRLYGNEYAYESQAGGFELTAIDPGTGNTKSLTGVVNGNLEWGNKVIATSDTLAYYLPLSGGTMTGTITATDIIAKTAEPFIKRADTNSYVAIVGGTANTDSGSIAVFGKDFSSGNLGGATRIMSNDGTNSSATVFRPNGSISFSNGLMAMNNSGQLLMTTRNAITRNVNNDWICVCGGTAPSDGASITLRGQSSSDGQIQLRAASSTSTRDWYLNADGSMAIGTTYSVAANGTITKKTSGDLIVCDADSYAVGIKAATSYTKGAHLDLYGGTNAGGGIFALSAAKEGTVVDLTGKPDGTLTWNNKNVVTRNNIQLTATAASGFVLSSQAIFYNQLGLSFNICFSSTTLGLDSWKAAATFTLPTGYSFISSDAATGPFCGEQKSYTGAWKITVSGTTATVYLCTGNTANPTYCRCVAFIPWAN